MINERYRLIDTQSIRVDFIDEKLSSNKVLVRPTYLSICAADQRYYQGLRPRSVMSKKLPLSLIHEAVGEIIYDPKGEFKPKTNVVLIPNDSVETNNFIKENYLQSSKFRGSSEDGFMQSFVAINRKNILELGNLKEELCSLLELLSVAINSIDNFEKRNNTKKDIIGVWGDGSVGYITSLILRYIYPKSEIYVFGRTQMKLDYFTFVDEIYNVNDIPEGLHVDQAFECVGGSHSSEAINTIIDLISPQGTICLLGVSEDLVPLNTRMILEKGLTVVGNSRSNKDDFMKAIKLLQENPEIQEYLKLVISDKIVVKSVKDIHEAFSRDVDNEFKTIMKWEI